MPGEIVCCSHTRTQMVTPQNKGIPIKTLQYYNPQYRERQSGSPHFGKPANVTILATKPILCRGTTNVTILASMDALGAPYALVSGFRV